ncbi:4-alpha-glucanotransferase [Candidatus Beckwithbacteria bacterium]|nr:4-alpha-glucanotransferase [Candidatus Beckwithbacteria bacterium]
MQLPKRQSGILLPLFSLPSKEGIGTLRDGLLFLDILKKTKQTLWQILPVHPTNPTKDYSPFQSSALFAGNPMLISLESLVGVGDLEEIYYQDFVRKCQHLAQGKIDYDFLWEAKLGFDNTKNTPLKIAFRKFLTNSERISLFKQFEHKNKFWLEAYAQFFALKKNYGFAKVWSDWKQEDKLRQEKFSEKINKADLYFFKYLQFVFDEQFKALRQKAKANKIKLIGDLAIYPGFDSVDVWANQELFQLLENGEMEWCAAVPPDYFSPTGQKWGNPLYKWGEVGNVEIHKKIFLWWEQRIKREYEYFDWLKFDHFRGVIAYGRLNPHEKDAINTHWIYGPGKQFFTYLEDKLNKTLCLIAEDLGLITDNVRQLKEELNMPGMKIFLFADFTNPHDKYLPANVEENCVFYTGTHDNETLRQKVEEVIDENQKNALFNFLNNSSQKDWHLKTIELISESSAKWIIFPMQDLLNLGRQARQNIPGSEKNNWRWQLTANDLETYQKKVGINLKKITEKTKRG